MTAEKTTRRAEGGFCRGIDRPGYCHGILALASSASYTSAPKVLQAEWLHPIQPTALLFSAADSTIS